MNLIKCTGAILLATALSVSAFAAGPVDAEGAQKLADGKVPSGSVFTKTEYDDGLYEVHYSHKDRQESYEVDISASTGKIVQFESELWNDQGGRTVTKTEEEAKKAVTGELKGAEIQSVALATDDGFNEYKVAFKTDSSYGEYKIHSETGAVLERKIKLGALADGDIGLDRARELAKAQFPGATLVECKADRDDGRLIYEAELRDGLWEYEVELDGATGAVLKSEKEYDD